MSLFQLLGRLEGVEIRKIVAVGRVRQIVNDRRFLVVVFIFAVMVIELSYFLVSLGKG